MTSEQEQHMARMIERIAKEWEHNRIPSIMVDFARDVYARLAALEHPAAERLAQAEALLQRVQDKEQAKQELQGFSIFRAPNTLLADIRAFLASREASDGK